MYPQQPDNSFVTRSAILGLFIVAIVFASILVFHDKATPTNFVAQDTSGGTSVTPKKSVDPQFVNFDALTTKGLSIDQSTGLTYAFSQFNKTLPTPIKTVTIQTDTIRSAPRDRNNPNANSIVSFDVTADSKLYKARVEYIGLSNVWLYLYDSSGAAVYESGLVNINTQSPN